jgi:hypothetical protein
MTECKDGGTCGIGGYCDDCHAVAASAVDAVVMPQTPLDIYREELRKSNMADGYIVANGSFTTVLLEGVILTSGKLRAVAAALDKAHAATTEV